ncbi:MAG: ABC-2 family transporter protein [Microgenomates group bacterium]|nr:ABC-2 family transporter protein [Microgenomates group bacterium]
MLKYWTVFKLTIKEYFVYRLNFLLWRLRVFLSYLVIFFIWLTVFESKTNFASYNKALLLTYLLISNLISSFVLGTRTADIGAEINSGKIINLLLKPISFFKYYLTLDLADKFLNFFCAFFEITLLVIIFKIPIIDLKNPLLFLIFFINGVAISFFLSLIISFLGFWTTETWAPRFIFTTLIFFLSGAYFPLDLLPFNLYFFFLISPFPYLFYLPTKILIGKIDQLIYFQFIMSFIWVLLSYKISYKMWVNGNKSFSFFGR